MRLLVAILTLGVLLSAPAAEAFIKLPSIKNKLIELALDQISSPGSFEVTVESIEEPADGGTSLLGLKVSDNEGVWLTAERLTFDWQPDRLLSGELAISKLELVGLDVARPPSADAEAPELKPQETRTQGPFDWPRAPIDLVIDGVRIERAHIAEGVLAQALSFDAEGHATDKGDLQELALKVTRSDAVEGRIDFLMQRHFGDRNTLKLDLTANEAPEGLVAAYAGLPADAPAQLELHADGTVENWQLDFDANAERFVTAKGTATLDYTERLDVTADFSVTPGPEMGQDLRTVLGDEARLKAELVEQPDGMIEVVSGALTSPAVQLTASGSLATGATGESDLKVKLTAQPELAALVDGVDFESFGFDGTVTGPAGGLAAGGSLTLRGLATAPADIRSLMLKGRVTQTADGARFDLSGSGEGLRLDRIGPDVIGAARLEAKGALAGQTLTLEAASLDSTALTASTSGRYDLAGSSGALDLELSAPRIAPVADAYGVSAEGNVAASAKVKLAAARIDADVSADLKAFSMDGIAAGRLGLTGSVTREGARISFDVDGTGEELRLDQVPPDLTRELRLAVRGAMEGDTLTLAEARIDSKLLTAQASGMVGLAGGPVALDYRLEAPQLGPVAAALGVEAAGSLAASGRVEGEMPAPRLAGEATLSDAAYGGQSYGTVRLEHDVTVGTAPEGHVAVTMSDGWLGDATAETDFRLEGDSLALSGLEAQLLGARAAGAAKVWLGGPLVDGTLDVSVSDLGPLGRLAGTEMSGGLTGKVTLTGSSAGQQGVEVALDARRLSVAGVSAEKARVQGSAADVLGTPRLDLRLTAGGVATGGPELETVTATLRGPLAALDFTAETKGKIEDKPLEASLAGRADAHGVPIRVTLSRAEVTADEDKMRLERPLELQVGGGTVSAQGLALSLPGDGMLSGSAALTPAGYTGDLTLEAVPLGLVGRWTPMRVTAGRLDARAVFDTRPGSASAKASVELRKVVFKDAEAAGRTLDVDLRADWDGAQHDAELEVRGDFGAPLRARLSVPLRPRSGALPFVPPDGKLAGSFAWSGRIGNLWALVPASGHVLDGDARIDLTLAGTMRTPKVTGVAEVTNGQYQNLELGTILTDLTIETQILDSGDVEVTLKARDGASGHVDADMLVDLGDGPVRLDMTGKARDAVLVRRDDISAAVSADVTLKGPLNDLTLKGKIGVDKAEVRLVNATPPEVVTLDGIRIAGAPEPEGNGNGQSVVHLDLSIKAKRDIFVRGRGLDSEWKMDLSVGGTAAQPIVTGRIEKIRGRLVLIGKAFMMERGSVIFDGGRKIDPQLDVYLQREDNDISGGILIEGTLSDPRLTFSSVPALPQDEVMPRLLFGESRQSLTGAQALQLAAGIATLTGSGGGGPIDALREAAGLDVLRVEGSSPEDAAVTVGRNIGEHVFIGAKQGLGEQGTSVTVEVEVFKNVTVDTEVGQEGNSNIGITLKKDF